jgi:hypothetical protein
MTETRAETTFEVAASPAQGWKALEELRARTREAGEWWLPGFDCRGAEVEAIPAAKLTVRKIDAPCADTLIAITFEHAGTGSRIHVVQSGFDEAFVKGAGDSFWSHSEHIFADVHLFFDSGVLADRAWRPWTPLGVVVRAEPLGLRVRHVGGGWAERVGLRSGDVLLTVAGAPLYTASELGVVERVVKSGDDVAATWVRDGAREEASAVV